MTIEIPPLQPPWSRIALVNDGTSLLADETMEAFDEHYSGKAEVADVTAALATKVRFVDQDGNTLPAGATVTIRVNTATASVDDITFEPGV